MSTAIEQIEETWPEVIHAWSSYADHYCARQFVFGKMVDRDFDTSIFSSDRTLRASFPGTLSSRHSSDSNVTDVIQIYAHSLSKKLRVSGENPLERVDPRTIFSESQLAIASSEIKFLSNIMGQLIELVRNPPFEEDEVPVKIAVKSVSKCREILVDASIADAIYVTSSSITHRKAIPYGHVSMDGNGGVRVEWTRDSKVVVLGVPQDLEKAYIYSYAGAGSQMHPATASELAMLLKDID